MCQEFKLYRIIREVNIPAPIDFVVKDNLVAKCLSAITAAVDLNKKAGTLVLDRKRSNYHALSIWERVC